MIAYSPVLTSFYHEYGLLYLLDHISGYQRLHSNVVLKYVMWRNIPAQVHLMRRKLEQVLLLGLRHLYRLVWRDCLEHLHCWHQLFQCFLVIDVVIWNCEAHAVETRVFLRVSSYE